MSLTPTADIINSDITSYTLSEFSSEVSEKVPLGVIASEAKQTHVLLLQLLKRLLRGFAPRNDLFVLDFSETSCETPALE